MPKHEWKLKDPDSCEGCPMEDLTIQGWRCLIGYKLVWNTPRKRPAKCKEEKGE